MSSTSAQPDVVAIGSMRNISRRASPLCADARREVFHMELILHEIFQYLDNDRAGEPPSNQFPKRDLLNSALSNKLFTKAALDVLWTDMHSLAPFFCLLPHETTTLDGTDMIITLNSFPTETNNPVFYEYARRLRHLTLGKSNEFDNIPILSLVRLASLQEPGRPIFPGLKTVIFTPSYISQVTAIYGIFALSSPITNLQFSALEEETATFATTLSFFSNRFSSSLKHLNLTLLTGQREFTRESLRFLPKFHAIHSLTISSTNPAFPIYDTMLMDWFLNLESLRVLEINIFAEPTQSDLMAHRGKRAASVCIRTLKLTGPLGFLELLLSMFAHRGVQITELTLAPTGNFDHGPLLEYTRQMFPNAALNV